MTQPVGVPDFRSMTIPERILLVQEIWDSIAAEQESVDLTQAEKDELDRRLAAYEAAPQEGSPWEQVKSRLQGNE